MQGASTVTAATRGYDAGKNVSGRKTFGITDSLGLLVAVVVVAANISENAGGIAFVEHAAPKSSGSVSCGVTPGSRSGSGGSAATTRSRLTLSTAPRWVASRSSLAGGSSSATCMGRASRLLLRRLTT